MFLGNDFGTVSYLEEKCSRGREENNKTIQNLLGLNLDLGKCFFTNFFLGLRDDKLNPGTTNIKKIAKFQEDYVKMCYDFFLVQLALINPKIIVCLGKEVGQTLSELNSQFSKFELKNRSFSKLYDENDFVINTKDDLMGTRKFVLIPHPSFAHINWGNEIKQKIKAEIIL